MCWSPRASCVRLRWSAIPVSQRTGGMRTSTRIAAARGTSARNLGLSSNAARIRLAALAPQLAPQGQSQAAADEQDQRHDKRDGVGRAASGARAGIARVERPHLRPRRAARVGERVEVAAAVLLARLDVRVLAELVPRDETDDVRRRALGRVELAQQRLAVLALDDALPADHARVE